jgi:hypothetical protein
MKVISELKNFIDYTIKKESLHIQKDRLNRLNTYSLSQTILNAFIVDKDHKNGLELHQVTDNGLIYIFNLKSKFFITVLNARPQQIKRYFYDTKTPINEKVKKAIMTSQKNNELKNYNNI